MEDEKIKIKLATMEQDIQYIKQSIDGLTNLMSEHIKGCETRYANKWVENVFVWAMKIVGGLIIVALVGLVIVNKT